MSNFPNMTEAQRAELIEFIQGSRVFTYLESVRLEKLRDQVALAALTRDNSKLAREITARLVDCGSAEPEVVASSEAWVLKKLNGVKS